MKDKFKHGVDYEAAKKYLQEIGVYERVIQSSILRGSQFEIIIAANQEFKSRNNKL